jgi:hypothetical protein
MPGFNKRKHAAASRSTVTNYNQLQFEVYNSEYILNQGGSPEALTPGGFSQALKYRNILRNRLLLHNLVKQDSLSLN